MLKEHPGLLEGTILVCAEGTLAFVKEELERFRKVRKRRELTPQERQYGRKVLGGLLTDLSDLVKPYRRRSR